MNFVINFQFVVYSYDPNTKGYKNPVEGWFGHHLFLSNSQETLKDLISRDIALRPDIFSEVMRSPHGCIINPIVPPAAYPSNPANMKVADIINCYKSFNPHAISMMIALVVMEEYMGA